MRYEVLIALVLMFATFSEGVNVLAYWSLNGSEPRLTLHGGPTFVEGPYPGSKAINFNQPSNCFARIPKVELRGRSFTIALWVKVKSLLNRDQAVFSDWYHPWQFFINIDPTGAIHFVRHSTDASWYAASMKSTSKIIAGKWYHVAVTWDQSGGVSKLYIDAKENNSIAIDKSKSWYGPTRDTYEIGDDGHWQQHQFLGSVMDLYIIDGVLNSDEIYRLKNKGANVLAYWSLNRSEPGLTLHGGPTFVEGRYPGSKAINFNQSSNCFARIPKVELRGRSFTIALWVKVKSLLNRDQAVFSDWYHPWQFFINIDPTGAIHFVRHSTDASWYAASMKSTSKIIAGKWYHVAVTWDQSGGVSKLYIDAKENNSIAIDKSKSWYGPTRDTYEIGDDGHWQQHQFLGSVMDLYIIDGVLNSDEIYRLKSKVGANVLAYWSLNRSEPGLTLHGGPTFVEGRYPGSKAINFNQSSNCFARIPKVELCGRSFTIALWVKVKSLLNRDQAVFSDWYHPWQFFINIDPTGAIHFVRHSTDASWYSASMKSTSKIIAGKWYHVAVTWDQSGGVSKLYIDAKENNSIAIDKSKSWYGPTRDTYEIGDDGHWQQHQFLGSVMDLYIIDGVLNSDEIYRLKNKGCHLPSEPINLAAYDIQSRSLTLSWKRPIQDCENSQLIYTVHYKAQGERVFHTVEVVRVTKVRLSVRPNKIYEMFVMAKNKNGYGPRSVKINASTLQEDERVPCNGDTPLTGYNGNDLYCGRGGVRCPYGSYCDIHPSDKYAKCCPQTVKKEATSCISDWVKMNEHVVCFGASENSFGSFRNNIKSGIVVAIKLEHANGHPGCGTKRTRRNNWNCADVDGKSNLLNVVVTDQFNHIIFPKKQYIGAIWYQMPFVDVTSSKELVFTDFADPFYFPKNKEMRIWYGEDLKGTGKGDNVGRACVNVYAKFMGG